MQQKPLLMMFALALVLLSALPVLAQQPPLFDPQTGAINPNGAWGNQPSPLGTPATPSGPYGGQQWIAPAPNQWSVPQPYNQPYSGSPVYRGPSPYSAPGACGFSCSND
jgi:hypothetical protein